jgi:hypothetical protein
MAKKVYKNLKTVDYNDLAQREFSYPLEIESVRLKERAFGKYDVLFLYFSKHAALDKKYKYGLVGNKLIDEFKSDMKVSGVEALVGKQLIGIMGRGQESLSGLMVVEGFEKEEK